MSSDISAPDRRIVYVLLGIAGAALIGWIVAVIVGATVTKTSGRCSPPQSAPASAAPPPGSAGAAPATDAPCNCRADC